MVKLMNPKIKYLSTDFLLGINKILYGNDYLCSDFKKLLLKTIKFDSRWQILEK